MEWFPGLLAVFAGGIAFAFALVAWGLGRNARWRHLRLFSIIAICAGLYAAGDATTWLPLVSPAWVLAWSHLSFVLGAATPALWLLYSHAQIGEPPTRVSRFAARAFFALSALGIVPRLVWTGAVRTSFEDGIVQRMPVPTRFGEALITLIIVGFVLVFVRYVDLARRGVAGARPQLVAFGAFLLMALHEVLVVLGVVRTPTMMPFALAFVILPFSAELAFRYAPEAETLADESARLNEEVARRTAELVDTREQLLRAERLTALGTLAASVGHEINNPLASVMMNLEWLRDELVSQGASAAPDVDDALSEAIDAAKRIRRIVLDLSVFARGKADGAGDAADVRHVVETSLRLVANQLRHRARVEVDLPTELPSVRADETRLAQVLVNLLVNAAAAIPDRPSRSSAEIDRGRIVVRARASAIDEGWVEVDVEDDGVGMSAVDQRRAFEPFFTTKGVGQGSGLGLYVSHGLVRSFGGEIALESAEGKGTRVRIRLPVATSPAHAERDEARAPTPRSRTIARVRVLVVDDDEALGLALRRMLEDSSHVEIIATAAAALDRMRNEAFDVVVCDLMLPGMSGEDLYEALASLDPELASRFVFMTGGPLTERSRTFVEAHRDRLLMKPFSRGELEAAMSAARKRAAALA